MPTTALDRLPAPPTPVDVSQATAVEQARAVAEVRAAVMVAQSCPRDLGRAVAEMEDACSRISLAERAFYRVPQRGEGPSVHLARELARIWGNADYGVKETRRDDANGVSEILAYAWDVQTNARSTRSFVVPHQRMKAGQRQALVDLMDVYLNNQNVGARAVRECIFSVIPTWFVDQAQRICRSTLEHGEGRPLAERIDEMVAVFGAQFGVKVGQLEARLGKGRAAWGPGDVAAMRITFRSIQAGETTVADEFGADGPSRETFAAPASTEPEPEPETGEQLTPAQRSAIFAAFGKAGWAEDARSAEGRAHRLTYLSNVLGREVTSTKDLTVAEASRVLDALREDAAANIEPEAAS